MTYFKSARVSAKLAVLMLGAGALAVGVANAGTARDDAPKVAVKYSDLSLTTDVGVSELYRRIKFAARQVCPELTKDLAERSQVQQCRKDAVARAVQQVNNSQLAALYAGNLKNS